MFYILHNCVGIIGRRDQLQVQKGVFVNTKLFLWVICFCSYEFISHIFYSCIINSTTNRYLASKDDPFFTVYPLHFFSSLKLSLDWQFLSKIKTAFYFRCRQRRRRRRRLFGTTTTAGQQSVKGLNVSNFSLRKVKRPPGTTANCNKVLVAQHKRREVID